jgi:holo-[acyl-carrier protein] synthase
MAPQVTGSHSDLGPVLGIGVDVVDLDRFARTLERTPQMQQRLFHPQELADLEATRDGVRSLAARFAAREAVMKALGVGLGGFDFHDVWVRRGSAGAPELQVEGRAARLAMARGVRSWHCSLSHSDLVAIAFVVAS